MAGGRTVQPWRPVQRTRKAAITVAKKQGVIPGRGCFGARLRPRGLRFLCELTVWQDRGPPAREHSLLGSLGLPGRVQEGAASEEGPKYESCGLETVTCPVSTLVPVADEGVHSRGPGVASVGASPCPTSAVPLKLQENTRQKELGRERGKEK